MVDHDDVYRLHVCRGCHPENPDDHFDSHFSCHLGYLDLFRNPDDDCYHHGIHDHHIDYFLDSYWPNFVIANRNDYRNVCRHHRCRANSVNANPSDCYRNACLHHPIDGHDCHGNL